MQKNIKKKIVDIPIEKNLNVGDIVYTKSCMCSGNEGVKPELSQSKSAFVEFIQFFKDVRRNVYVIFFP